MNIVPIGAPVEHRGLRVPSMMRVSDIVSGLRLFVRPLWRAINLQIAQAYPQAVRTDNVLNAIGCPTNGNSIAYRSRRADRQMTKSDEQNQRRGSAA